MDGNIGGCLAALGRQFFGGSQVVGVNAAACKVIDGNLVSGKFAQPGYHDRATIALVDHDISGTDVFAKREIRVGGIVGVVCRVYLCARAQDNDASFAIAGCPFNSQ